MERTLSTDQRLDELANRMEAGFRRLEERLESRMDAGFARIDSDVRELRGAIFRFGGGIMVGLVGVILALIGVIGVLLSAS